MNKRLIEYDLPLTGISTETAGKNSFLGVYIP